MSKLHVVEGPLRGKSFEVTELASIGRGESCAVRLDGRHISRIHARLERRGDAMFIRDNGSRNGIFVNGQGVRESVLRPDDLIEIGEHVLVFDPTSDPSQRPRAATTVLDSVADPFSSSEPDERLPQLARAAAALTALEDEKEIARRLLDSVMAAVPCERGFVLVTDETGHLKPVARKAPAGEEELYLSNVLHHQLAKERRAVLATDVLRREPHAGKTVGILCAPLAAPAGFVGLTYLESKLPEGQTRPSFAVADLRYAAALGVFAGTRIVQLRHIPARGKLGSRSLSELTATFEKEIVVEAIRLTKGDLEGTAKLLGLARPALDEKLKVLGVVAGASSPAGWKSVQF